MSNIERVRTVEMIAAEINAIKDQTRNIVLYNSIEIGRRLVEAKEIVGHGEWANWLESSVDYSQRTANNLMKIFKEYGSSQISLLGENLNSQTYANLSYSQALELLSLAPEEREGFVKENDLEHMSTRELKEAIKEKQKLESKVKKYQEENKNLKNEIEVINSNRSDELINREAEIENLRIHIKALEDKIEETNESDPEVEEELNLSRKLLQDKAIELGEAYKEIENLKKELEEKPIEVNASIPEEVTKELEELRNKVISTNSQNLNTVKFKVHFEEVAKGFNEIIKDLREIEDEEINTKFKAAVKKLISDIDKKL